ncbi:prolyl oligopeptidase family serine peptidase [Streptomyces sp. So13.3]|uniref:prolyl oligopeptidase family serine peptidase n=1 Tax=Streptomyces TaxID=1883 RepID=UPI00164E7EFA|nr:MULTISPECIES: prolyl oligopeptidase family serine peptidase [Streptomyces]QNA77551.1 prolyl oligopeptidase family serine peptidase [Streptomyces sp. So13.3]
MLSEFLAASAPFVALVPAAPVRAAALWYAPTDLQTLHEGGGDADSPEGRLLGAPPAQVIDLARAASPVWQVSGPAVPFLIMHGAADESVPASQGERLHARLLDAGADSTLVRVEGAGHCFVGHPDPRQLIAQPVAFLAARLGAS